MLLTRSNVGASFAIPTNVSIIEYLKKRAEPITNKFMLAPPSASSINIRRNSTQHAASGRGGNQSSSPQTHSIGDESSEVKQTNATEPTASDTIETPVQVTATPPPIPKRTLLGKIIQSSFSESAQSPTLAIKSTINNVCKQTFDEVKRRNTNAKAPIIHTQNVQRRFVENHYPIDQNSDEDRLSIESSVFEEPKSSDPIISLSNRSSSDSNKSQTTIDTGYMSASNDNDRIFFGASEDFRSRFSSVDTQSSIDSCTSSDLQTHQSFAIQNQARCIISPLAVKRDEYEEKFNNQTLHGKTFSRFNSSNSLVNASNKSTNSNCINSVKSHSVANYSSNRIPFNLNRDPSVAKIAPPSGIASNLKSTIKTRPAPPLAPAQTDNVLDSGRLLYNGSMLGAFQSGLAKISSAAATTSEVVMGRRSFKKAAQIAHTKLTQRQDSNDSFSLSSSPSYNTKNADSPLLTNSKNNRACSLNNQDVTSNMDGFATKFHFAKRALRQDSNISNDSFSQLSSPGFNAKQLEQPLILQNAKARASKFEIHESIELI